MGVLTLYFLTNISHQAESRKLLCPTFLAAPVVLHYEEKYNCIKSYLYNFQDL